INKPGITAPASPAHGPWQRLSAQAFGGDVRLVGDNDGDHIPDAIDPDDDNDGLTDVQEATYGTNPVLADTDGDGLSDGEEVLVTLTDPLDPDTDHDGYCDGPGTGGGACTPGDNCPTVANADQANHDSYPAGDACQCGDVTGNGTVAAIDVTRA